MKAKLFKGAILIVAIVGLFYILKPEKVQAPWDFDRGTGTWVNDGTWAYCRGSWWSNSCIGTGGAYNIDGGYWVYQ